MLSASVLTPISSWLHLLALEALHETNSKISRLLHLCVCHVCVYPPSL
jgi:hypothetical protein